MNSPVRFHLLLILVVVLLNFLIVMPGMANHIKSGHKPQCDSFYGHGYCTDYVKEQFRKIGIIIPWYGNAIVWKDEAEKAKGAGWTTGQEPKEGAIAVFRISPAGHVALVKSVSSDRRSFVITQANYKKGETRRREGTPADCHVTNFFNIVTEDTWSTNDSEIIGFIYPPFLRSAAPSQPVQPPKPQISSSLQLFNSSGKAVWAGQALSIGQTVAAQFSIKNFGGMPIVFDVLTVGGRLGQTVVDFPWQRNIMLAPNAAYAYRGSLTLGKPGNYHFFTAYRTRDGQWNTAIPVMPGVSNTIDIAVSSSPSRDVQLTPQIFVNPFSGPVGTAFNQLGVCRKKHL